MSSSALDVRQGPEKKSLPRVSVVIPTRNRCELLKDAVDSLKAQTLPDWEVIVVDDASDDHTQVWLSSQEGSRLRAIRLDDHAERSTARNRGLRSARGRYVVFLDDDDRFLPRGLELLSGALDSHPDAVAAVGGVQIFSERGTYRGPRPLRSGRKIRPWCHAIAGWCGLQGQSMYRRSAIQRAGGFRTGLEPSEDQDLWMRLGHDPVVLVRPRVVQVRSHPGQGSHDAPDLTDLQLRIRQNHVASLPENQRADGERAIRFWLHWRASQAAYSAGNGGSFRRELFRAVQEFPSLVLSPLFRVGLGRRLIRSYLPGELWRFLRRARTRLGRGVGG